MSSLGGRCSSSMAMLLIRPASRRSPFHSLVKRLIWFRSDRIGERYSKG